MKCEYCNQNDVMISIKGNELRFCSKQCASKYSCEIRKKTNLAKYGVENVFNNTIIRNKGKQTCLERYGTEHACQSLEIQEKIKSQWVKYDGGHPWSDSTVRQKREDTLIQKYGVKHPILSQEIHDKINATVLERFGVTNAAQADIIKQKISVSTSSKEVRLKKEQASLLKYGVKDPSQRHIKNQLTFLNNKEWLSENINRLGFVGVATLLSVSLDTIRKYSAASGIVSPSKSSFESQVYSFIVNEYKGEVITNTRLVDNKEIDIYLPELNLAIECNGSYWHSELNGRTRSYHIDKTKSLNYLGIHLIHIWEHDWIQNQIILKSRLRSLLNKNTTIYARKCNIRLVDLKEASQFLLGNHIQGHCQSSIRLGLYHNNVLVSLMSFGKSRFNGKIDYELLRFVNLVNYSVVGGASKLFKHFVRNYSPNSIISYSDKSFNKGLVYEKLGFTKTHSSTPAYYYTRDYKHFENRIKYQKHKLKNLLEIFDANLSEWDNMKLNGYDRIWDCGNDVWLWNTTNKSNASSL